MSCCPLAVGVAAVSGSDLTQSDWRTVKGRVIARFGTLPSREEIIFLRGMLLICRESDALEAVREIFNGLTAFDREFSFTIERRPENGNGENKNKLGRKT